MPKKNSAFVKAVSSLLIISRWEMETNGSKEFVERSLITDDRMICWAKSWSGVLETVAHRVLDPIETSIRSSSNKMILGQMRRYDDLARMSDGPRKRHKISYKSVTKTCTFLTYNMRRNLSRRFIFPITRTLNNSEVSS